MFDQARVPRLRVRVQGDGRGLDGGDGVAKLAVARRGERVALLRVLGGVLRELVLRALELLDGPRRKERAGAGRSVSDAIRKDGAREERREGDARAEARVRGRLTFALIPSSASRNSSSCATRSRGSIPRTRQEGRARLWEWEKGCRRRAWPCPIRPADRRGICASQEGTNNAPAPRKPLARRRDGDVSPVRAPR